MEQLSEVVDRLTTEHLATAVRVMAARTPLELVDHNYLTFGLATEVLRFFFGGQWTNEHVFSMHLSVSAAYEAGRKFLRTDSTDPEDSFRHGQRVTKLAQTLFNLQGTHGLRERIALKGRDGLEGLLGELECAALLCHPALAFRFRIPISEKGQDYDAEVTTSANRTVCCEFKTKSESIAAADAQSVWSTLDHARDQMPKNQPGLVFIKIPEAWVKQCGSRQLIESAIAKVFRRSRRLVGVVLLWEMWNEPSGAWRIVLSKFDHYANKSSELYQGDIDDLFGAMGKSRNSQWLSFHTFVEQVHSTLAPDSGIPIR
jgi:hypothetical protein